jgi:alpha-glucosidase
MKSVVSAITIVTLLACAATGANITIQSPNGTTEVTVMVPSNGQLQYRMSRGRKALIEASPLGIHVDGTALGRDVRLGKPQRSGALDVYAQRGVHAVAVNHYRSARIPVTHTPSGRTYLLEVRVFDDGLGFRYVVPGRGQRTVAGEATAFQLPAGSAIWGQDNTSNYEAVYQRFAIEAVPAEKHFGPPLVVELPGQNGYAAITEAALFNYSGMTLQAKGGTPRLLTAAFQDDETWTLQGTVTTPWRVVMASADLDGLVNCDIVTHLNDPPAPALVEAEWIRPGRAFWHWWSGVIGNWDSVAFENQFGWIDHAAAFGFEFYLVDAGWDFTWKQPGKDAWVLLKDLCAYAADRGVGIFVWKRWRTGKTEGITMQGLDNPPMRREFFRRCREAGVAGVKIDFMDSESKERIDYYTHVLQDAAEYELMINFHGANKPTGESRTWPNEISREGIRGLEFNKWSALPPEHYASLPFTRLLAGHGDFTPCTFNPAMLKGTTFALQLASAICFTSPLLHYADRPELYLQSPAVDVIKAIPSVWDQTRVLPGSKIGDLAVMARRRGDRWFVGIINGADKRSYRLDLSFLGEGSYQAVLLNDNPERPDALVRSELTVGAGDRIDVDMNKGGGFVAMLTGE